MKVVYSKKKEKNVFKLNDSFTVFQVLFFPFQWSQSSTLSDVLTVKPVKPRN
jgi:hypothetical protein